MSDERSDEAESGDSPIIPPTREPARDPSRETKKERDDEAGDEELETLPGEDLPDVHVKRPVKDAKGDANESDEESDEGDDDDEAEDADEDSEELPRFVTMLAPIEHQVGMHVIEALRRKEVAGVVSTVIEGPDGLQRIVSVGLNAEQLGEVDRVIMAAVHKKNAPRVPCIGFHCHLRED